MGLKIVREVHAITFEVCFWLFARWLRLVSFFPVPPGNTE